ncbi:MAG: helix-turn-helix transcriptional regulator [Clostridiales bacterium]|nr:helix-turn-helix transcriptional regulator [Clostridiales bacterium]
METINQTVAWSVLQLRKETGFSQLMLATEARIALKTLHAAERAASNLRLSTLEKMVGAFGIPVAQLFEQKQSAPGLDALIELLVER